jgi:WhiB family redox-sensing transcriptional regulator
LFSGETTSNFEHIQEGRGDMFAEWGLQEAERPDEALETVDWSLASCRSGEGSLLELFFSEQLDDIARAKGICAECALREPCLEGAVDRREPWGVWGGQLFVNGKILPFKRKRGRPPKNQQAQLTA